MATLVALFAGVGMRRTSKFRPQLYVVKDSSGAREISREEFEQFQRRFYDRDLARRLHGKEAIIPMDQAIARKWK